MSQANTALLRDRGVASVTGPDAATFLDNLVSNDLALLGRQDAVFAGLLSPQGKILFDFFIVTTPEGYLLDVAADRASDLAKRLTMYKLRAKVDIMDRSEDFSVLAEWDAPRSGPPDAAGHLFDDPRHPDLGRRRLVMRPVQQRGQGPMLVGHGKPWDDYHAHRIALGVPEGGHDFNFGDVFPHEALMDKLAGVSFTKGCYVGQEIVARMEHRGTARKRFVRVSATVELPGAGSEVTAGEVGVGVMGSHAGAAGLALLRLDRVAELARDGVGLSTVGVTITANSADIARLMPQSPDPTPL